MFAALGGFISQILQWLAPLFLALKLGESNEKTKNSKAEATAAKAEAKRHADTPVTAADAAAKLRQRAAAKRLRTARNKR